VGSCGFPPGTGLEPDLELAFWKGWFYKMFHVEHFDFGGAKLL
jgi:hypothetical protein